jgi:hypothetical protein
MKAVFFASAILAVSCGGDRAVSTGGDGGATRPTDGAAKPADQPGGACVLPACLSDVVSTCVPQGACTDDPGGSAGTSTTCWDNGVAMKVEVDTTTFAAKITYTKPGGGVCWWYETPPAAPGGLPAQLMVTYRDGADRPFATLTYDTRTARASITCPGQAPVTLAGACVAGMMSGSGPPAAEECRKGTCP